MIYKLRSWRSLLITAAQKVRGQPYVWGTTDCVSLTRALLAEQFGQDVFPELPQLMSVRDAIRLHREVGFTELFAARGARELPRRINPRYPMGAILVTREASGLPGFGTYVEPILVQSELVRGTHWINPASVHAAIESAWLLEEVRL